MPIKVMLIGLGNIGFKYDQSTPAEFFYSHAKALNALKEFQFICAISPNSEERELFKNKYQVPSYASIDEVENEQFDLIVVATPSSHRLEIIKKCERLEPKLILLEKPLALTAMEGQQICDWSNANGCQIYINYIRRCDPSSESLKEIIEIKKMGQLLKVNVIYNRGLLNSGTHFIDFLNFLLGEPRSYRLLSCQRLGHDYSADFSISYNHNIEVIFSSIAYNEMNLGEIHFYFEEGIIRYLDQGRSIEVFDKKKDNQVAGRFEFVMSDIRIQNQLHQYQLNVYKSILDFYKGKSTKLTSMQSGLNLINLCENIVRECK